MVYELSYLIIETFNQLIIFLKWDYVEKNFSNENYLTLLLSIWVGQVSFSINLSYMKIVWSRAWWVVDDATDSWILGV